MQNMAKQKEQMVGNGGETHVVAPTGAKFRTYGKMGVQHAIDARTAHGPAVLISDFA